MKTKKITKILIVVSVVAIVFDLARLDLVGRETPIYLIWNLFLAWIPYVISFYLIKKETSIKIFIPLFILWLLFFPNAPYLVTDVMHIVSSPESFIWYDSLLFFLFGWIGLLLGIISLFQIHQYLKNHFNYLISEVMIFVICFVSSFGVYLGRFERWNSWDFFFHPLNLIKDSINISAGLTDGVAPLTFVSIFCVFLYTVYKTIYILIANEDKNFI
jgi:uncharacterized membrane protein